MDSKNFDAITRLAANAPDRRNMLKLAGAAAVLSTAGLLARSDDAEAALINVVITNVLNDLSVDVDVHNNKVAVQICAVVNLINTILDGQTLTCEIGQ
jgi:hypothetical protein